MDNLQLAMLNDKFNMYYTAAKKAQETGNGALAKRNFLLAAETMLSMAELSSPQLKKARTDRARRLIEIAEGITVRPKKPVSAPAEENAGGGETEEEEGALWTAAPAPDVRFSDIAGLDDVKRAVTTRMINPVKYPDKYRAYNKKTGGGVLLYGPPGTGKTMVARAIAGETGAAFYVVKGSDIVSKWVGDSEKNIRSLFETARAQKLAIIFIDEMDSLLGTRGMDTHNDKRVNEFLQQMDGFIGTSPNLMLLGATNRPWDIDSAALRSGRFSQKIYVPLPDAPAREFMFRRSLKDVPCADDVSVGWLVKRCDGYSGADIAELCDRAKDGPLLQSIETGDLVDLTKKDFLRAFREVKPTVSAAEVRRFEEYAGIAGKDGEDAFPEDDGEPEEPEAPADSFPEDGKDGREKEPEETPEDAVLSGLTADAQAYRFDWDSLPKVTFDDVAGLADVKETVRVKVLLPLSNPDAYEGYEKKAGGGLLLYGPPGTGKTMIAAAIANEIGAKFCSVKPSDLLHQGAGNSERAVRALFAQARSFETAVIYFDEMDSITPKDTRSQYAKQLRSELLAQLQGMEAYSGKKKNLLFLIAATNKPWDIDSAFLRPGRFGIRVYVGLPDYESRKYMLDKRLDRIRANGIVEVRDTDTGAIAEKTNAFNGADISHLLDKAEEISILRGVRTGEKYICQDDFTEALETVHSSVQRADIEKLGEWRENTTV